MHASSAQQQYSSISAPSEVLFVGHSIDLHFVRAPDHSSDTKMVQQKVEGL